MGTSGVLPLIMRTTVSLAIVLAVIGAAYAVVRRRAAAGGPVFGSRRRAAAPAIEVVGRAGLARGATAVALRFGDRVVMVGVCENASTAVLADIDAALWDELHPVEDTLVPTTAFGRGPMASPTQPGAARPRFVDALRDATTRRA